MNFIPSPLPPSEIIVAARDADARVRSAAAYRCTGTNDEVAIAAAIAEAGVNGK